MNLAVGNAGETTKAVKMRHEGVKKPSTDGSARKAGSSFGFVRESGGPSGGCRIEPKQRPRVPVNGDDMGVLVYIVLTVLIFGLLGLVQKLVEGL